MINKKNLIAILFCFSFFVGKTQDTCRVMSYNLLNFDFTGNGKDHFMRTVIAAAHPDILVVQELIDASGANRFRDSVMLLVDGQYKMGTFIDSYDTDRIIFYRNDKFDFISNTPINTNLRDINQFKLIHKESDIIFYVYTLHLKASSGADNELQRKAEADSLRKYTSLLPDSSYFIVAGDFNIYNDNEDAYFALTDSTTAGFFVDPLDGLLTSTWNNSSNAMYHTQSTRVRSFGGGATGGLDDRFDMILFSKAIHASGGIDYLEGSYTAFGNDGDHYNDSINSLPNTSVSIEVADALHYSSDHIPVFASFVFPMGIPDTTISFISDVASNKFQIFPNPVTDQFTVSDFEENTSFYLTDLHGRKQKEFLNVLSNSFTVNISELPEGIYFLTGIKNDIVFVRQIIKS